MLYLQNKSLTAWISFTSEYYTIYSIEVALAKVESGACPTILSVYIRHMRYMSFQKSFVDKTPLAWIWTLTADSIIPDNKRYTTHPCCEFKLRKKWFFNAVFEAR